MPTKKRDFKCQNKLKYWKRSQKFHWVSPRPKQHNTTMAVELRYNRRFPTILTHKRKQRPPAMLVEPKIIATVCTFNGIPYALITWMMYGRQQIAPENSNNTFSVMTRMNGFKFRFRFSSLILSQMVAVGCWQAIRCLAHDSHAFTNWMWFWSFSNSSWTWTGLTQPRNHCNDFFASFGRSFDSSQFGDSGIFRMQKRG